ncbi:adenyl-nucleotide exchange factor [Moniliophthora roreri]|uniref:Nucleotide exchange factor Fes1 domain-containing protein n=1 Tax=Moniliophthora roreri TaxID=221103 RepID=A0A0W0EYU0_MONRR|nr:adenyl-nucleotide exchange factor [Moniliophthora roreri]
MESLLRWSIQNSQSDGANPPPQPRKGLDPGIIDAILGKSDAEQMKEDMAIATDVKRGEDERIDALDHLEMLIEHIDNANDLEKLKLWEPLHSLLTSDSSTDPIILQALWVIGTALQNNPSAQDSYLSLNPLATLTSFLSPSSNISPQIRSKVIYTLSGLLKHNATALTKFDDEDVDGWVKLRQGLQDPDISVRRKIAFLLNTLLTPTSTTTSESSPSDNANVQTPQTQENRRPERVHPNSHSAHLTNPSRSDTCGITKSAIEKHGIVSTLVDGLTNPLPYGEDGDVMEPDIDFEEKGVGLLRTYTVDCDGELSTEQKDAVKDWIDKSQKQNAEGEERWGLSSTELKELVDKVQS